VNIADQLLFVGLIGATILKILRRGDVVALQPQHQEAARRVAGTIPGTVG
jgi:hypothetical protein